MSVLEVRNLTVEFGQRGAAKLRAVDGLSFALNEGQTLALVGESGSGKSTVVRAVGQLVKRKSGEILLNGEPAGRHRGFLPDGGAALLRGRDRYGRPGPLRRRPPGGGRRNPPPRPRRSRQRQRGPHQEPQRQVAAVAARVSERSNPCMAQVVLPFQRVAEDIAGGQVGVDAGGLRHQRPHRGVEHGHDPLDQVSVEPMVNPAVLTTDPPPEISRLGTVAGVRTSSCPQPATFSVPAPVTL